MKFLSVLSSILLIGNIFFLQIPNEINKNSVSKVGVTIVECDNDTIIGSYLFDNVEEFEKINITELLK